MTDPTTPERPTMDDDLDRAYARAHALADDGRGPSASVRANVLATAARIAAGNEAAGRPPVQVALPLADVGRGRPRAVNLSSWKVRSGAALCAMLLAGLALWRLDQNGRFGGGEQVAQAELRLAQPQAAAVPRDLPPPAAATASAAQAVVEDAPEGGSTARVAAAKKAARDKEVVVAQLDEERSVARRAQPSADAAAQAAAPVAALVADAARPAPVVVASNAPRAEAAPAPAPPQESTRESSEVAPSPPQAPSVLPRRVLPAPKAAPTAAAAAPVDPAAAGNTTVASADADSRVADAAQARALSKATASRSALPSAAGSLAAAGPGPLQAAAARGDLETLRRLLADPVTPVDAPDAAGRTALLDAVLARQPGAVRLLLAAGADPGRADRAGLTPRAAAQAGANAEIAALLAAPR